MKKVQTFTPTHEHRGYSPGHPWYYFLGGQPLSPRDILEATRQSGYQGYARDDIKAADQMAEPKRSETLRRLRAKFLSDLRNDLSRYRECIRELRQTNRQLPDDSKIASCGDIHTALSLKHNHMVNNFAHLIALDDMLAQQRDFFELL